jgi:Ni,Fe-hydrogenase III large subunit
MTAAQLQVSAVVEGTTDAEAGRRAKAHGMGLANEVTPADWAARCDAAIRTMAAGGEVFQAADLIEQQLVDEPEHPSQWGPRFQAAAAAGVIETAGYAQSKRATVRASVCHTWRGTGAA